jgi:3-hydroxy-9,10-secoandrosta-1,3,5(10)-triene-9,17-dione monooxygenase
LAIGQIHAAFLVGHRAARPAISILRGSRLAEKPSVQYSVAKSTAMVEAVEARLRDAIARAWDDVSGGRIFQTENRLRFRRALTHAVDTCIEVVSLCYREAGGSAVHQSEPIERALRDIHTIGGHIAVQRGTLETAGGVAMGVVAMTPMF